MSNNIKKVYKLLMKNPSTLIYDTINDKIECNLKRDFIKL